MDIFKGVEADITLEMSPQKPRIGLLGGAFDPPHLAHRALAEAAITALALDELIVLPTGQAWHKARPLSPAEHRVAMARLLFAGLPRVTVDERETCRAGATYTIDTLRELIDERPGAQWFLIIGEDQARAFGTWREWRSILDLATVCVAARGGSDGGASSLEGDLAGHALMLPLPRMDLSATQIRERVAAGQPVSDLAGSAVAGYIARQHLYSART